MLDRRLNAFRDDLADISLQGQVEASRFSEGEPASVIAAVADVRGAPSDDAGLSTQLLSGDAVKIFERRDGWAWVQAEYDGYVGYVRQDALGPRASAATHLVAAPRTFVYPHPDLKTPHSGMLSLGSRVAVSGFTEARGTSYAALEGSGFAIAGHLASVSQPAPDYVTVAETLIHTPYLWGGASGFGIDCSGLVQLSMRLAGRAAPRDSDMQAASLGEPVERAELRRGDLVFWKGHVAIATDPETIIHANGATMMVSVERLDEAIERIGGLYGLPTGCRRP